MVLSVFKIEQNMKNNVSSAICAGMFFCARDWRGGEGIYIGKIDMKMLREYRATEVMGNAYRHPGKYKIITECGIEEPFVRADYRN